VGRGGLHPLLLARNAISVAFVVDYIRSHSSIFLVLRHEVDCGSCTYPMTIDYPGTHIPSMALWQSGTASVDYCQQKVA